MRTDVRAIDIEYAPVDAAVLVERDVQPRKDPIEQTFARPSSVAPVNGLPLAVALGHVAPLRASVEDPEHPVEDGAMVGPLAAASLGRQYWLDAIPCIIGEFVAFAGRAIDAAPSSGFAGVLLRHRQPPC